MNKPSDGGERHGFQRPAAAAAFLGVSRTTLHRLSETDPTFPRKIVITPRCVGYRTDALAAWLLQKEAAL